MNVQDVINMALNGQDGRAVEPARHETCADEQIAKLASALNFIGSNLEDSVMAPAEILAQAELIKEAARRKKRTRPKGTYNTTSTRRARRNSPSRSGMTSEPIGPKAPNPTLDYEGAYRSQSRNTAPSGPTGSDTSTKVGTDGPVRTPPTSPESEIPPKPNPAPSQSTPEGPSITDAKKRSFMDVLGEATGAKRVGQENFLGKRGLRAGLTVGGIGGALYGGKKLYDRYSQGQQQKSASATTRLGVEDTIAQLGLSAASAASGYHGAQEAKKRMRAAGMSDDEIAAVVSSAGGAGRGFLRGLGYGVLGSGAGHMVGGIDGNRAGTIGGMGWGAYRGYKNELERADAEIKRRNAVAGRRKTASVDDVLAHAAHVGKQALLEKVAEDRINPAKISAGPAAPYSGEIMPASSPVFGGQTMPNQLVALKAQKVRNRINTDMKQYVSNVGDGYNLQGHLNKFNK